MSETQETRVFLIDFWSLLFNERVSAVSKLLVIGFMVAYALSPIDLIPDILVPIGFGDDVGVIGIAMYAFVRNAREQVKFYDSLSDEEKVARSITSNAGCTQIGLGCFALIGSLAFMAFAGVVITVLAGVLTLNSLLSPFGDMFNWLNEPTTAQVVNSRTLISSLQPLGQLVSVSAEVAQADIFVGVNRGGPNLCGHSAMHVAQGVIEAGVDITQVGEDSVNYDEETDTYTITLPAPSITSCRIEYIRQYEHSGGNLTCAPDWDKVRLLAQYETTVLFASDTIEGGILERAERETTLLMQSFISALTGSEVKIVYASADGTELPASCQPQLPRGWVFDDELNAWMESD